MGVGSCGVGVGVAVGATVGVGVGTCVGVVAAPYLDAGAACVVAVFDPQAARRLAMHMQQIIAAFNEKNALTRKRRRCANFCKA